jgi:hypothetical protein
VVTATGKTREEIVTRLAQHIDSFEKYSGPHSMLMADLSAQLASRLGLAPTDINAIAEAALLHDIGLYQMSPAYLYNAGPLSLEERIDLWRHPIIGEQEMAKRGASRHAQLLVRWHHEWWNGAGYPDMLSFEDIPIGARIIRAVELYSALMSDRPYRPGMSKDLAREILRSSAGIECDPYIVTVLLPLVDEFFPVAPAPTQVTRISSDSIWTNSTGSTATEAGLRPESGFKDLSVLPSPPSAEHGAGIQEIPAEVQESALGPPASSVPAEIEEEVRVTYVQPEAIFETLVVEPPTAAAQQEGVLETLAKEMPPDGQSESESQLRPEHVSPDPEQMTSEQLTPETGPLSASSSSQVALGSDQTTAAQGPTAYEQRNQPPNDMLGLSSASKPAELSPDDHAFVQTEPAPDSARYEPPNAPGNYGEGFSSAVAESAKKVPAVLSSRQPAVAQWHGWLSSPYNTKSLLGFEVSVLRHVEFRSIAIAFAGWSRLAWYLKAWGRQILSNDPRSWAAAVSRALLEPHSPLTDEQISDLLHDIYVPGTRLGNPELRTWFGETDSWWMDNLRRKIDQADPAVRERALLLGLQTGDYAQSFSGDASELKRPLTTVFKELAGELAVGFFGHPTSRAFNLPVEQFIASARADLLFLNLPPGQAQISGAFGRSAWREAWVNGSIVASALPGSNSLNGLRADSEVRETNVSDGDWSHDALLLATRAQSKQTYLAMVDRHLASARAIKKWAIECRDIGLASASDISDLIKRHRAVRAIYSKDLTEVAGGMRHHIIIADVE